MTLSDIRDIKISIDTNVAKKIFGNQINAKQYLLLYWFSSRELSRLNANWLYSIIVNSWNYEKAREIIRTVFKGTKKYSEGKSGEDSIELLINEWKKLWLWDVGWPFSQWAFDNFVQALNSESISREEKDKKVQVAAVKYRRIKEINTVRNDFIETLIFERNDNIIPTLGHNRGVDFFINWVSFDQKVAKSPTNEFKRDFGENWKQYAKEHPEVVWRYLYQYQDEGRFWSWPRLYVVYLDEDITPFRIKEVINWIDLNKPLSISFDYWHQSTWLNTYQTQCFVILLYK